jgi:hypothetical protein
MKASSAKKVDEGDSSHAHAGRARVAASSVLFRVEKADDSSSRRHVARLFDRGA